MTSKPHSKYVDDLTFPGLGTDGMEDFNGLGLSAETSARRLAQRQKRGRYYLKGPLFFDFIRRLIPDPTSRVVMMALAFMDMEKTNECVLSRKIWDCAGINNADQRRRVLVHLRKMAPEIQIINRPGRSSVLILKAPREGW